jgi:DNA-directed RNA polymerase subunit L
MSNAAWMVRILKLDSSETYYTIKHGSEKTKKLRIKTKERSQ